MVGEGRRDEDVAQAALLDLDAEVDVVEGDGEILLVQAADGEEGLGPHEQAGRRHGRDLVRAGRAGEIAVIAPLQPGEGVTGHAAVAEDDAAMLYRVVGVQQLQPHRSDVGTLGDAQHVRQPALAGEEDVVVQQQQEVARRLE